MIVAFTGIREIAPTMTDEVEMAVLDAVAAGATELRFGGANGADAMALAAACRIPVRRRLFLPFTIHDAPPVTRELAARCAIDLVELDFARAKNSYLRRNDRMIDGAARVVAFTDGRETGGTAYTMKAAAKAGIPVTTVTVASTRDQAELVNPAVTGLPLTAPLFALQEYVSAADGRSALSSFVRENKTGNASSAQVGHWTRQLIAFIQRTESLRSAHAICAMPRRVPGAVSDMLPIARAIASDLDLVVGDLRRIAEPTGGVVRARRLRFEATEHTKTLAYIGCYSQRVIVLDNVVTTGATMNGAFAAVREGRDGDPVGLALLYSTAFGATPVEVP